jgi:hypothetical protein
MSKHKQLADGTVPSDDTLDAIFEQFDESEEFDMSNIFPGAGTYAVTVEDVVGYVNPKTEAPSARAILRINKVEGNPKSKLVGRTFSTFFSLSLAKHPETGRPPIAFTAQRLHRILVGEHAKGTGTLRSVRAWLNELRGGAQFIVSRTIQPDKNGVLRAKDTEMSFDEYRSKNGDTPSVPEEKPEVAAEVGSF